MRNIQIQKRKGMSIGDMYPAVLTIVLVGIVLGVGLYVLSTFGTQITPDVSGSQTLINASAGTTTLTDAALANFKYTANGTVINASAVAGTFTNYTVTEAGVYTWGADIISNSSLDLINVTYTYTYDATDSAQEAITTTTTGLATFADWIAIIVVVIAAAIVLGVVLTSFGGKRNRI